MNPGEQADEHTVTTGVGRRRFLVGAAAATTAVVATACSGSGSDAPKGTGPTTTAPRPRHVPRLAKDPFTLGVASGDPTADSVIVWTRLAPDPTAPDGGMPSGPADVVWEVADDRTFATIRATGVFTTEAAHAHSAHVEVTGLSAGTTAWYRFRYADWTSPVAQTRTLPTGSPTAFALGVVNCQMYEAGYYAAYRHLVDDDVDLVVHLGDYIYEYPFEMIKGRRPLPHSYLDTLGDFRLRYASYKRDPDLQAAHHRYPFIATWDDHEVANNYMGDVLPGDPADDPGDQARKRKAIAYQAWWEHQPSRLPAPTSSEVAVYQAVEAGDLLRLHLLDERQYAAIPPCRDSSQALTDYGDCEARTGEDRTRLGDDQESWLTASLAKGGVTWNLLGNPVVLAGVNGGTDQDQYYLDTWDGYPQARERLIAELADVDNPVVLTGDYHAGMVLDVHATPFDPASAVVAPEFMAPPISSVLFPADVSARTPQLRQQINAHGYLKVAVTPKQVTATFRCLADVADPKSAIDTRATWTVQAGNPTATKA